MNIPWGKLLTGIGLCLGSAVTTGISMIREERAIKEVGEKVGKEISKDIKKELVK